MRQHPFSVFGHLLGSLVEFLAAHCGFSRQLNIMGLIQDLPYRARKKEEAPLISDCLGCEKFCFKVSD